MCDSHRCRGKLRKTWISALFQWSGTKPKFQIFYTKRKEQLICNVANVVISNGGHVWISCGQAVQPNAVSSRWVFSNGSSPLTHVSGFMREMSSGMLSNNMEQRETVGPAAACASFWAADLSWGTPSSLESWSVPGELFSLFLLHSAPTVGGAPLIIQQRWLLKVIPC